jgi:hypothetical protein
LFVLFSNKLKHIPLFAQRNSAEFRAGSTASASAATDQAVAAAEIH